jgi:pimeloyl-ACP methyl ester carboxylesterase
MQVYSGRAIEVPACFIAGRSDWGTHQKPGDFEKMQSEACTRMEGVHLIEGAGHWVQQEQPGEVSRRLAGFLEAAAARSGA